MTHEIMVSPRQEMRRLSRQIEKNGPQIPEDDPLKKTIPLLSEGVTPYEMEVLEATKVEFYALLSVLIDGIMLRAQDLKDFGQWPVGATSFRALGHGIEKVLDRCSDEEIDRYERLSQTKHDSKEVRVYNRAAQIVNFYATHIRDGSGNVSSFIKRGIGTAERVMPALLNVIPEVYERRYGEFPLPHESFGVAEKSFALVSEIALTNSIALAEFNYSANSIDDFGVFEYDPGFFSLKETTAGPLLIRSSMPVVRDNLSSREMKSRRSPKVLGCPAMDNLNGRGSAIKTLWKWHLESAENIYAFQYKRRS